MKLIGECGKDLRAWPSAKHFTSWLCLAPGNKISGARCCPRGHGDPQVAQLRCCGWQPQPWGGARQRWEHSIVGCPHVQVNRRP
nr:IS110 family transposase [Bradyrhizobium sp. 177]